MEREYRQALPIGSNLENYRLVEVLGVGGFGITYRAVNPHVEGLEYAIKEYLPTEFAVRDGTTVHPKSQADQDGFEWGLDRFVEEAKTLVLFRHRNLVRVQQYFWGNNTAYIVMDYEVGQPLNRLLTDRTLTEAQLLRVLLPVADGLKVVHAKGYLHRDIKPANIFIRKADDTPVLLDFGAARQAIGRQTKTVTAIASAGYSPPEQYYGAEGEQGPWTDIYSLSAVCYRAITGKVPEQAPWRQSRVLRSEPDPIDTLEGRPGYRRSFLQAIDAGLRLIEAERPQELDSWLSMFVPHLEETDQPDSLHTSASRAIRARIQGGPTAAENSATQPRNSNWLAVISSAAVAAAAVIGLFYVAAKPAPESPPPTQLHELDVMTVPEDAEVVIRDADPPYHPGNPLPPGDYQIDVSADGYEPTQTTVAHGDGTTRHHVVLTPAGAELTVATIPEGAQVRIVDGPPYAAGMLLATGRYELEVTAPGYESERLPVLHGTKPTRHHVALVPNADPQ